MLGEVKKVAPSIFENAGARCKQLGYCPELESCGLMPKKVDIIK
jgi:thymidylate synthase (FAD)